MLINPEKKREKFNFLENIEKHEHDINYIFGYHEFGDYGVRLHKHWLSGYENVKMEVIPEAGHTIWLDRPELFQNTLIRYLN